MVTITIDNKKIGDGNSIYFVAEAGLNHNGDVKIAKKMIDAAYKCGADAIKFQTYKAESFLSESSQYFKFFKDVELDFEEFGELNDYAKSIGLTFFSTPFDVESADYLKQINVPCFKIASSDLTNVPLLSHIAAMNLPMIVSTGLATMQEIQDAVEICNYHGNKSLALLHCVANYPTVPEEANMSSIITMREKFGIPVGYSDNGDSTLVDLVAASIGADIIEKHFTLDRKMEGPDHFFSIDPSSLTSLIQQIRTIEKIRGDGVKIPQQSEINNRNVIRKSLTAAIKIRKGEMLTIENVLVKRPATGIEPKYFSKVIGKQVNKDIEKDTPITWYDF
ncbi:MAG: N-acetylneuraminate synthase family protein [Candidatus Nitrosotenuis sp.]